MSVVIVTGGKQSQILFRRLCTKHARLRLIRYGVDIMKDYVRIPRCTKRSKQAKFVRSGKNSWVMLDDKA